MLLAEGLAGLLSGNIWGRLSDQASHRVMALAAILSAGTMTLALIIYHGLPGLFGTLPVFGGLLLLLSISHQGVRIARKTYLVDIATVDNRAQYTAVSNTIIGLLLFLGAGLGFLDAAYGAKFVMMCLVGIALVAAWYSVRLTPA